MNPESILTSIREAANDLVVIALLWHVVIFVVIGALLWERRPPRRVAVGSLGLLALSVSVAAWLHGNPFNGAMFLALALALGATGVKMAAITLQDPPVWARWAGAAMLAFGLAYPHFLDAPAAFYLIAAPTGVVPCPTLAVLVGFTLLARGFDSRWVTLLIGGFGLLYGVVGVLYLRVMLDVVLAAGSLALIAMIPQVRTAGVAPLTR